MLQWFTVVYLKIKLILLIIFSMWFLSVCFLYFTFVNYITRGPYITYIDTHNNRVQQYIHHICIPIMFPSKWLRPRPRP